MRITIDSEHGITLDDCEYFSKSFGALLDVEDPVRGPYTLEVSSPGLDRPLRSPGDFEKNIGRLARVITIDKIDNQNFFVGRITGIHGTLITLSVHDREIGIPFENISKARLEIEL